MTGPRVTRQHLERKVNGLNVKHNKDIGDNGCLHYEIGMRNGVKVYQAFIKMASGCVSITPWGMPAAVIAELDRKNWRHLLEISVAGRKRPW